MNAALTIQTRLCKEAPEPNSVLPNEPEERRGQEASPEPLPDDPEERRGQEASSEPNSGSPDEHAASPARPRKVNITAEDLSMARNRLMELAKQADAARQRELRELQLHRHREAVRSTVRVCVRWLLVSAFAVFFLGWGVTQIQSVTTERLFEARNCKAAS
jgi:hypothetical protein